MSSKCKALHFPAKKVMNSLLRTTQFSECCQKKTVLLPSPRELRPLLRHLLTNLDTTSKRFRQNIRVYSNSLAMAFVKADEVCPGSSTFTSNPTMTVHGLIHYYLAAMMTPSNFRPSFLFVSIHNTEFVRQSELRAAYMPNVNPALLQQLISMLHECNNYVQSF